MIIPQAAGSAMIESSFYTGQMITNKHVSPTGMLRAVLRSSGVSVRGAAVRTVPRAVLHRVLVGAVWFGVSGSVHAVTPRICHRRSPRAAAVTVFFRPSMEVTNFPLDDKDARGPRGCLPLADTTSRLQGPRSLRLQASYRGPWQSSYRRISLVPSASPGTSAGIR